MGQVRIADLPTTSKILPESFLIIERPGVGEGTFKSTVGDVQKATTSYATVSQQEDETYINLKDINGETNATIITPTVTIEEEQDLTTISVKDYRGTTESTITNPTVDISTEGDTTNIYAKDYRGETRATVVAPTVTVSTEGPITNIHVKDYRGETDSDITSPTVTVTHNEDVTNITATDYRGTTESEIISPTVSVTREGMITTIRTHDYRQETVDSIVTPTARIIDNGDNTATITITDVNGQTQDTIVSRLILDDKPTKDSPNFLTSGTIYNLEETVIDAESHLAAIDLKLASLASRAAQLTASLTRTLVIEDANPIEDESFICNGKEFATLSEAILDAISFGNGEIILASDAESSGIAVPSEATFTLDLNGYELDMTGPGAGSPGTETNGFQFLKDSNITIKNGTLVFDDERLKIGIQNYSNLTLDNVKIIGGSNIKYVLSNNYGNITLKNGTEIIAYTGKVAFDCWYGMKSVYDIPGVNITIEDDTVVINGAVEFGKADRASAETFKQHASITCPTTMTLPVTLLTTPCEWYENGDGTKTLKYSGE